MSDRANPRLDRLIGELAADLVGYATTRKFPRQVPLDDAAAIAARLQAQIDKGVEARAAAVATTGAEIACKRGCTGCCEEPIMVFRPEAARVAQWLAQPAQAATRAQFVAAYPAWKARIGELVTQLSHVFVDDAKRYTAHHVEAWKQGVLCPFNVEGDCTVYDVRPIVCRTGHALETSAHCSGSAPAPATRATFVPLDQFIAQTRKLLAATHNATAGQRGRPEALPHLVAEMLGIA